MSLFINFIAWM